MEQKEPVHSWHDITLHHALVWFQGRYGCCDDLYLPQAAVHKPHHTACPTGNTVTHCRQMSASSGMGSTAQLLVVPASNHKAYEGIRCCHQCIYHTPLVVCALLHSPWGKSAAVMRGGEAAAGPALPPPTRGSNHNKNSLREDVARSPQDSLQ